MLSRSRFSSQRSAIDISCQPTIPYNDSPIEPKPTDLLITKLIKNGELKIASRTKIKEYKNIFESESMLTTQHITGESISMPHNDWEFTFNIYFPYSRSIHHSFNKYNNKYKLTEKIYAYTTFRISYYQLQKIDNTIIKRMSSGYKYFPYSTSQYPLISKCQKYESICKKRGHQLMEQMKKEQSFINKPSLPNRKKTLFNGVKSATTTDLLLLANYLNIVLSSPSLCKETFIFDELLFSVDLKSLLRLLSMNKLEALKAVANQPLIRDPSRLLNKLGNEYIFHTLYIVRRPLNDSSLRFFNFNHWAIKMEGKKQLMTIEFFAYNDKHGIVTTQILPNTSMNRRVFWCWWPSDEKNKDNENYFTTKWVNIESIYIGSIQIECIGKLIIKWLSIDHNYLYSATNNNCQHFVRDLCTIFDMKIARKLNGVMDHRVFAAAIPAAALADGMSEEARTNRVYIELKKIVQQYKNEQELKKLKENKENEQQKLSDNWKKCAQELGIDFDDDKCDDDDNVNDNNDEFYDQFENINHSNTSSMVFTPSNSFNVNNNNNNNNNAEIIEEDDDDNGKKFSLIKPNLNMNNHLDNK